MHVTTPVDLIVGPARSGKAARVLAAYRDALAAQGPGSALMLVPTALRQRRTENRLLAGSPSGVLIAPHILTLPTLANRLLDAAGRTVRRIGDLARRRVIHDCLAGLPAKEATVLGEVRSAPGLIDALDALFRELKAARVEPDAFGRALAGPLRTPRNRLLARLYDAYQKRLQALDVYDDQGRFWHAAALLADGEFGPFGNLALLAVDGFQRFDPAQMEVIEALSARAERTLITLPWAPDRPALFGVTGRTRDRLRARFGDRLTEVVCHEPPPDGLPADLERIRMHLFRETAEDADRPAVQGHVSVIRAAGRTREVEAVARSIVDLVRGGAGVCDSIAVIARSLADYAPLVRQVFPRYGLPFRVDARVPLTAVPVVRAAMALIRLQARDYAFRSVAGLLQSGYFRPAAFGGTAADARAAVRLARDAGVWTGRDAYGRGFAALRGKLARRADAVDEAGEPVLTTDRRAHDEAEISRAEALLSRVFQATALPGAATRRQFAQTFRAMIAKAGLWQIACTHEHETLRARDLKALAGLDNVLEEVARLDDPDDEAVAPAEFVSEVERGLGDETIDSDEPADAPVLVLDADRCRALSFRHVFVVGLSEKAFPRRGARHPFFGDADRTMLRTRHVDLADTGHAAQDEMLRFYLAVTRAEDTLTLAYPSLDPSRRPQLPSHYLEEVRGLFAEAATGPTVPQQEIGVRDLDLPASEARSRPELLAASVFALWGPGENPHINRDLAVLEALAANGPAVETALAGLAAEWQREHGDCFGPFDGCLSAPDILEDLCRRYPGESPLSAGRLERFGRCPFAFLAGDLLGLEPREDPSAELAPLALGTIVHGLLERFFRAAATHKTLEGRVTEDTLVPALALLEETAATYFASLEARGDVGSPALWSVQRRNLLRDVRAVLTWHAANLPNWRVTETERDFGDAASLPVTVPTNHGLLRLRGRIDRIDRGPGDKGYQVVDYKLGASTASRKDMAAGTSFQLPVYLMAAQALLGPPADDAPARAFFLPVRKPGLKATLSTKATKSHPNGTAGPAQDRAAEYIRRFVDAIRGGRFPVYPRGDCSEYCGAAGICRYAAWQSDRKWDAAPIAELDIIADDDNADDDGRANGEAHA